MTRKTSRTLTRILSVTAVVGVGGYAVFHHKAPTHADTTAPSDKPKTVALVDESASYPKPIPTTLPTSNGTRIPPVVTQTPGPNSPAPKPESKPVTKPEPTRLIATGNNLAANLSSILSDGKAKIDAGELLAGRKILNDGLISGQLTGAEAVSARQMMSEVNKIIVFSPRRFDDDPWACTHQVAPGEILKNIANKEGITSDLALQMNGMSDARKLRAGTTIKLLHGPFHIVVNKKSFNLDLYLGSPGEHDAQFITNFPVGLGKDDSTPGGTWIVSDRIRDPKWWGARGLPPIESGDPKNPLGKFWLALTGTAGKAEGQQSYGIHGTIDPESIGKQASMGCIRMRNEDVAVVYTLVLSGKSTVVVKD